MGLLKGLKDMKQMVNAAPGMVQQAQVMQANAAEMGAAMQQQALVQQQQAMAAMRAGSATATATSVAGDAFGPIAGVTVEQYVAVVKGIAPYGYDQSKLPMVAASLGIEAGAWAQAAEGFNARVTANPAFAQHFNTLYRQA